ncbi:TIGR01548 family HAD-type hydrolase [Anthocerotibacter panamensis]|uniref:TIGR01548 family HAD-type hydrolase n=1 Tax=Anthocerotibacter panamensis TaxID=2857077 RepID=UPI001C40783C|nr:TIGR01548 family HAD-type hydrolase [Anthocerotibacter panamensis]
MSQRPSWDEYFMSLAKLAATRSTCRAVSVGAVIVKDRQVLATGYNGPPRGFAHCTELGYCYVGVARCDLDQSYTSRASHAEANAIAMAARKGISVEGATMYTTLEPCLSCTKLILAAGLVQVFYEEGLTWHKSRATFAQEMPIPITALKLSTTAVERAVAFLEQPTSLKNPSDPPGYNPTLKTLLALDIDGVVRDVQGSYLRALADTVAHFTGGQFRPSHADIDELKSEGVWNNDWEGSQELVYRYFEGLGKNRAQVSLSYPELVDFFQERYLGQNLDGYIRDETLLIDREFFDRWDRAGIGWGFVSGASRKSAQFILCERLGLVSPPLVAMGEAREKPDPEGLQKLIAHFQAPISQVVYCGDTVADMLTITRAAQSDPTRTYRAVGVLPPHNLTAHYRQQLIQAGAHQVVTGLAELTVEGLEALFAGA